MSDEYAPADPVVRVSTLELFFDLVFVFTVTQLTSTLAHDLSWNGLWHVGVLLGLIFWMYGGYAWLTNAVPASGLRRRSLLIGGMCAYLVIALSVPTAFSGDGLAFGLAWFVIVSIHTFLFVGAPSDRSAAAMRGYAPFNLVPAVVIAVTVTGAIGGTVQDISFALAAVFVWSSRFLHRPRGFEIGPAHGLLALARGLLARCCRCLRRPFNRHGGFLVGGGALAGGVAVFLAGDAYFRAVLGLGRAVWRLATGAAMLVAVPVATEVNAATGLGTVTMILAGALTLEYSRRSRPADLRC